MMTKLAQSCKESHALYIEIVIWDYTNILHENFVHNLQLVIFEYKDI